MSKKFKKFPVLPAPAPAPAKPAPAHPPVATSVPSSRAALPAPAPAPAPPPNPGKDLPGPRSRQQRILAALAGQKGELTLGKIRKSTLKELRSRVRSLPAMILRHGVVQVLLFLGTKEEDEQGENADALLARVYLALMKELATDGSPIATFAGTGRTDGDRWKLFFEQTAAQAIEDRMQDQILAAEVATWLARMVETEWQLSELTDAQHKRSTAAVQ